MKINDSISITLQLDDLGKNTSIWLIHKDIFLKFNEIANNYEILCRDIFTSRQTNFDYIHSKYRDSINFFKNLGFDEESLINSIKKNRSTAFFDLIDNLTEIDENNPYYLNKELIQVLYEKDSENIEYYGNKVGHYRKREGD